MSQAAEINWGEGWSRENGPKGLFVAVKKLRAGATLTSKDMEWLEEASADDFTDGADSQAVIRWRSDRSAIQTPRAPDGLLKIGSVISDLFGAIDEEVRDIKTGFLEVNKACEVAKFRTMQLRTMELLLQAGHLEIKLRCKEKKT